MGIGFIVSGCSPHKADTVDVIHKSLRDSSILVISDSVSTKFQVEDPSCFEPGHGGFFTYGGDRPCSGDKPRMHGAKLRHDFSVGDPALVVQKHFFTQLTAQVRIANVNEAEGREGASDIPSLVFQFRIFEWRFLISDANWLSKPANDVLVRLQFGAGARLRHRHNEKILWAETCFYRTSERSEGPYRYGDLLAANGRILKELTDHAAQICGEELASKLMAQ